MNRKYTNHNFIHNAHPNKTNLPIFVASMPLAWSDARLEIPRCAKLRFHKAKTTTAPERHVIATLKQRSPGLIGLLTDKTPGRND